MNLIVLTLRISNLCQFFHICKYAQNIFNYTYIIIKERIINSFTKICSSLKYSFHWILPLSCICKTLFTTQPVFFLLPVNPLNWVSICQNSIIYIMFFSILPDVHTQYKRPTLHHTLRARKQNEYIKISNICYTHHAWQFIDIPITYVRLYIVFSL